MLFIAGWYGAARIYATTHRIRAFTLPNIPAETRSEEIRDTLTIVAYNIAHGRGPELNQDNWSRDEVEQQKRLTEIGERVLAAKADIVVLNEVDFDCTWSHRTNQARWIARAARLKHLVEQANVDVTLPRYRWKFGNAILSRYPTSNYEFLNLPPMSEFEDIFVGNHDGVAASIGTPQGDRSTWRQSIWKFATPRRAEIAFPD